MLNAMENHKKSSPVQQSGCGALATVLWKDSSWAPAVVDAGCIDRVITAMKDHPNSAELQEYGCNFLSRVAHAHDDYRKKILHEAKGLGLVVEALRIHNNNNKVKRAAQNALKIISA